MVILHLRDFLRDRFKFIQSFCLALGKWGCYFFCLLDIAKEIVHKSFDVFDTAYFAIKEGFIVFNMDDYEDERNFFISEPTRILEMLTGFKFDVRIESPDYVLKENEYAVEEWSKDNKRHFARTRKGYNSLQSSICINEGKITSLRVFRRK